MRKSLLKVLSFALAPLIVGVAATAALATCTCHIVDFLFGGPAVGWQQAFVVALLFVPIAVTLAVVEYGIWRHCAAGPRRS